jgi:hypothetical protein
MNALPSAIFPAPLDPHFQPAVLFNCHYVDAAKRSGCAVPLVIGIERKDNLFSRYETIIVPEADAASLPVLTN